VRGIDFTGKVCLVTGASKGIGAAAARGFGAAGAAVGVHFNSDREGAEAVARAIGEAGGRAKTLQGDVARRGTLARLVRETVAAFGRLDVLVNNAGDMIRRHPIAEIDDAYLDRMIDVNVRSVVEGCREAVAVFRRQTGGGAIINVSSVAARTGGGVGSHVYAGCKGFVSTFTRTLAKEVARENIRVNALAPGVIATPLQDRTTPPEQLAGAVAMVPMRRAGTPEDCVGAFLYLASPELSGYVTGEVVEVNGGLLMD
jgi:3-oxoacyl-[acyl-carrier protein] reductase